MHIYCITNLVNYKIYIGQHNKENLEAYLQHNLRKAKRGDRGKTILYNAFRKYGADCFKIQSLVRLPEELFDKDLARVSLDKLEQFFIRTLNTQDDTIGYNITGGGGGQLGLSRPHSEEWKKRMSEITTGRTVTWGDKISEGLKGRKYSDETKEKMAAAKRGKKQPPRSPEFCALLSENKRKWWAEHKDFKFTDETRAKMSASAKGKTKPPISEEIRELRRENGKKIIQMFERNPDGTLKPRSQSAASA